ncbi:MAG: hypothetical protein IJU72_01050 [Bacteroidales bacterium]|nr:hypothetical protein [Bacteroidales bacterium]
MNVYIISLAIVAACIGLSIFLCTRFTEKMSRLKIILSCGIIVAVTLSIMADIPQYSMIDSEHITVKKGIGKLQLPRSECKITALPSNALSGSTRTNGSSGPWGNTGWFNLKKHGRAYVLLSGSNRQHLAMVEHGDTKYVFALDTTAIGVKQRY